LKLLVIHNHYQQAGGEDTVVKQEVELLDKQYTVEVMTFQNTGGIKGMLQFLISVCNIRASTSVRKKIREFKPDVVHLHNWHYASGPWIIRTVKKMNVPIVITLHNYRLLCPSGILLNHNTLFLNSLQQSFPWTAIKQKVYRNSSLQTFWLAFIVWLHKKIGTWNMVDGYICLTPFAVDLFKQSSLHVKKDRFFVKPNFSVSPLLIRDQVLQGHFLFIGRLSEEKGINLLLEAFKESGYTLKIAGDGPLKQHVLQASQAHPNIIYMGLLSKEEITEELQKAQALVFPSVWYEGMPMTILEAFSTSTPVIASNIGAMSTMIQHHVNGIHFECNNIDSLKVAIAQWMQLTEQEKNRLRSNAFASYQALYSPEQQLNHFETIYKKVLN